MTNVAERNYLGQYYVNTSPDFSQGIKESG